MTEQKGKKRNFRGMSYRVVQLANSKNRSKLHKKDQIWLKENFYKNVGWDNVINIYQKIEEFIGNYYLEELTLEELFIEADKIGNKYLTNQEINDYNQSLSKEVNEVAEEIDKQFPETEIEFIDFSQNTNIKYKSKPNQKTYRTVKI
ncbi:MAG: hypothetical protein RMY16_21635 [Nostoc sp. DedQUE12b]|uniref:hypothetical protein n=1 Tax=Nostoc sp. DedQUE12b TaxID=3075398 RepID=UPI002AD3404F|nr:hypothetical protein [Nostoc sp. DedQUE12b]MDZ8088140.1 hypothetical protein [Nostoc sp. DedQUE12b]